MLPDNAGKPLQHKCDPRDGKDLYWMLSCKCGCLCDKLPPSESPALSYVNRTIRFQDMTTSKDTKGKFNQYCIDIFYLIIKSWRPNKDTLG